MEFKLTITCDNAAFEESSPGAEVARIIKAQLEEIESMSYNEPTRLRDINGNTVGTVEFKT